MEKKPIMFSDLTSFEQSLVVLYDIDLKNDMQRLKELKHKAIIDYYLSDIHYIVIKRIVESEKGNGISDEELESFLRSKRIYIGEIPKCFLTDTDQRRVSTDLDYLAKYNELYGSENSDVFDIVVESYSGKSRKLMSGASTESVKKHYLFDQMGIREYLKQENKLLDEKLRISRLQKEQGKGKAKQIIDLYKSTFNN